MTASGGFSDVKSILSDIKFNLQSAESRHQSLVKQWCSEEPPPPSPGSPKPLPSPTDYPPNRPSQNMALLRNKLPVPAITPTTTPEQSLQDRRALDSTCLAASLHQLPRETLEALRENLERDISALEAVTEDAFTLVQTSHTSI